MPSQATLTLYHKVAKTRVFLKCIVPMYLYISGSSSSLDSLIKGIFDKTTRFFGALILISNVAFKAGSSQHGNALLASVEHKKVIAANLFSPSRVYLDL